MTSVTASFIAAFVVAAATAPGIRSLARWVGLVRPPATPGGESGKGPALLGGVALFCGFLVGAAVAAGTAEPGPGAVVGALGLPEIGILVGAAVMFGVGVLVDTTSPGPSWQLIAQVVAGAGVATLGVVYPLTPWAWANIVLTIFWFIAVITAFDLLKEMDGVPAGLGAVSALFLTGLFAWDGEWLLAAMSGAAAGATIGFLPYNFPPASVLMGGAGSLAMGALLAGLAAAYPATASGTLVAVFAVPIILVAVPMVDAGIVGISRALAGQPLSAAARDQAAHRLVGLGLSRRKTAALLYGLAVLGGGVATTVRATGVAFGASISALFLIGLVVLALYAAQLQRVDSGPLRPTHRIGEVLSGVLYRRRVAEILLDLLLFAIAYYGGHLLRYDGNIPPDQVAVLERTIGLVVVMKALAFGMTGIYRGVWRQLGFVDLHRLLRAVLLGSLFTAAGLVFFFRGERFARGALVIDGLLAALLTIGVRASFRSLDMVRRTLGSAGKPTLIYGAGRGGEIVLREIDSNREVDLRPVGFIDDDPTLRGRLVQGLPVLGGGDELATLVRDRHVATIVVATPLDRDRRDALIREAERMRLGVLELDVRLDEVLIGSPPAAPIEAEQLG